MIKIGILSFSDGRKRVHDDLLEYIENNENKYSKMLIDKNIKVIKGSEVIWNTNLAKNQAEIINSENVDGVILNIPVFAFPNLVLIAAGLINVPLIAISSANGKYPGLGGVLASTNLLLQNGIKCEKLWGYPESEEFSKRLFSFVNAVHAVASMKGMIYGLIGGRSIGMGTGAASPELLYKTFGIDTDHIDQLEILRLAKEVPEEKVEKAFNWLSNKVRIIKYDSDKLTKDSLKEQIRCYIATKQLIRQNKMDFVGVKCHYELSEYKVAQCLSAALMNDPYDWDGEKETTIFSCEADTDGAVTMQVMKLISGKPVIFADFRHFDEKDKVFVFCNCGSMSSWYADRSNNPENNLKKVSLWPLISKYGGKGCHVQFIGRAGEVTFGRLTHSLSGYKMIIFKGRIKDFPEEKVYETCPNWPHCFVEVDCNPYMLIDKYINNHVHGIEGDYVNELVNVCKILDIEYEVIK